MMDVYVIQEGKNKEKSFWTKIGSAFPNKDGSTNIYLSALPINGKLQIRERREEVEPEPV